MDWPIPPLVEVLKARQAIAPWLRPTPTLNPPELADLLGCRVVLKCEHLNPTASFKVRGAVNLVSNLSDAERRRGLVAASTGNFAQAVAFAGRQFAAPVRIVMPEGANPVKVAATRALGADVVFHGADFDLARLAAVNDAARLGMRFVHSANEPLLVTGVGTYALELLEAVPEIDVIFVPIGAGSGALGTALVARALNPAIQVIGVQAEGAPAVYLSWKEGRYVETERIDTFAEGLATRQPFELPRQWLPELIHRILLVSDAELRTALALLVSTARQVVEGAGAAALAGALQLREALPGKTVALILSGGNVPFDQLRDILNQQAP